MKKNPIEELKGMSEDNSKTNKEYDVRFCNCGSIHFIEKEVIESAIESNKEVILICGSCGSSILIGAEKVSYNENPSNEEYAYEMYSKEFRTSFTTTKEDNYVVLDSIEDHLFYSNPVIRYSIGKRPTMMTGNKAESHSNGRFNESSDSDTHLIAMSKLNMDEARKYGAQLQERRSKVNMKALFNTFTDDELRHLSQYLMHGFDWSGTKYE